MKIGELKRKAKLDMKNGYGYAILTVILLNLVAIGSILLGILGIIFVAGAVARCYVAYFMDVSRSDRKGVDSTYRGFKHFGRVLKVFLWKLLILVVPALIIGLVCFLICLPFATTESTSGETAIAVIEAIGCLLIAVYAVIVNVRMYFRYHVMVYGDKVTALECIKRSSRLTKGQIYHIIRFGLSFIGWHILVVLTLGTLSLYVQPYFLKTKANYFFDLVGQKEVIPVEETPTEETPQE